MLDPDRSPALRRLRQGARRKLLERYGVRGLQGANALFFSVLTALSLWGMSALVSSLLRGDGSIDVTVYAGVGIIAFLGSLWYRAHARLDRAAGQRQVERLMTRVQLEETTHRLSSGEVDPNSEQGLSFVEPNLEGGGGELSVAVDRRGGTALEDEDAGAQQVSVGAEGRETSGNA